MDKRLFAINMAFCICDFLICALAVAIIGYAAFVFDKWWIALFALIPVSLYTNHGIIVNSQIEDADFEEVKEDGA